MFTVYFLIAPGGVPENISVFAVTSTNITVTWERMNCVHHNGDIIGNKLRWHCIRRPNNE